MLAEVTIVMLGRESYSIWRKVSRPEGRERNEESEQCCLLRWGSGPSLLPVFAFLLPSPSALLLTGFSSAPFLKNFCFFHG